MDSLWFLPRPSVNRFLTSFTLLLVLIEILVFAINVSTTSGLVPLVQNPTLGPSRCGLLRFGAKYSPFVVLKQEYWRLVSCVFMHSGMITLVVSVMLEYVVVLPFEIAQGRGVTVGVFFYSAVSGYVFSSVANPISMNMGALPGILGIVGIRISHGVLNYNAMTYEAQRRFGIIESLTALLAILVGQSSYVDNYASFVGFLQGSFVGGALYAHLLDGTRFAQHLTRCVAAMSSVFICVISIFLLMAGNSPLITLAAWSSMCPTSPYCVVGNGMYETELRGAGVSSLRTSSPLC